VFRLRWKIFEIPTSSPASPLTNSESGRWRPRYSKAAKNGSGALRELHWHPHADEWQFYVKGRGKVTIFGSHGRVKTEEFGPGHVAFIKQGYGHFIEQVGDEPTRILILFNSGLYQEISLTNWLGGNPNSLLTSNFGISQDMLDKLPKKEVGILGRRG